MLNDPDPITIGTLGTVRSIRQYANWTQVDVDWDNGRQLMLCLPDDRVEVLPRDGLNPKGG